MLRYFIRLIVGGSLLLIVPGVVFGQSALEQLENQLQQQPAPQQQADTPPQEQPGYLGAITDVDAQQGIRILDVLPQGPADQAGLRQGDVIFNIDGKSVRSMEDFAQILTASRSGSKLHVRLTRNGEETSLDVALGDRPPVGERRFRRFGKIEDQPPALPNNEQGASRPLLGVRAVALSPALRERLNVPAVRGAVVTSVTIGSPADRAAIPLNVVIVAVDDVRIDSPDDLAAQIQKQGAEAEIELSYYQGNTLIRKRLQLAGEQASLEQQVQSLQAEVRRLQQRVEQLERRLSR